MKLFKKGRSVFLLLCFVVLLSAGAITLAFADYDDPESMGWAQCPYCDEWSPPGEFCEDCHCCVNCYFEHHCFNCGACMEEAACPDCLCCDDCMYGDLAEYHCQACGECFYDLGGGIGYLCPECGCCEDCGYGFCPGCGRCHECIGEERYCPDCGCCHECLGFDEYCSWCNRCSDCAGEICPYCNCCEDCQQDMGTHCAICGQCLEEVGHCVTDPSEYGHCADCCIICDQCGECMLAKELEQCPYCGLCEECCRANSEDAGCSCGICIESPEWDDHICSQCGTPFCQTERCDYCGLCEECCRANSEDAGCSCGICIESSEWEEHICPRCGTPFCQTDQCDYCGLCVDCCRENTEDAGCDCEICIESPDWYDHICPDCGTPFCQTDHGQCEYCGLCAECCRKKSEDRGCDCGICIESPDWEIHTCSECGKPFCQTEQCGYCGLCIDCCGKNSACSEGMCVMNPEYETHICVDCGRCFHDSPVCGSCFENGEYRCRECCKIACAAMGCDCGDQCVSDPAFQAHLNTMHSGSGTHEYVPRPDWSFDEEKHWKGCRYCDDPAHISELAGHSFDSEGVCTVCGYSEGSCQGYITRQPRSVHCQTSDWYAPQDAPESMKNNKVTFTIKTDGAEVFQYHWILVSGHYDDDGTEHDDAYYRFDEEEVYYSNSSGLADLYDNSEVTGEEPYIVASGCLTDTLTLSVPADVCCPGRYYYIKCEVIFGHDNDEGSADADKTYIIGSHRFNNRHVEALPDGKPKYWIWKPYPEGGPFRCYENAGHRVYCCSDCCNKTRIVPHEYEETGVAVDSYLQVRCKVCGYISYIPKPVYTWSDDCSTCYAYRLFVPGAEDYADAWNVEEEEEPLTLTSEVTKPPTCSTPGELTYTATFAADWAETQTKVVEIPIDPDAHVWGEPEYIWTVGYEDEPDSDESDYLMCEAFRYCIYNPEHQPKTNYYENYTFIEDDWELTIIEPTCTKKGQKIYTVVFDEEWAGTAKRTVEIDALGHDWGEVEYIWSEDNKTCTAKRTCKHAGCTDFEEETVDAAVDGIVEPTCTEKGVITYSASFTRDWAQAKIKSAEIPPSGHGFGTEWKSDGTNHWHECSCGEKADAAEHDWKWVVDKEATATEPGSGHEECEICGYKKKAVDIPAKSSTDPVASETGGKSHIVLWIVLSVASLGIIAAVILLLIRRRKLSK